MRDLQICAIMYLIYYIILFILILKDLEISNGKVWEYVISPFTTMIISMFIPFILGAALGIIMLLWKIILIATGVQ